jgi:transcriptional regulator with XRE-family HTH domain
MNEQATDFAARLVRMRSALGLTQVQVAVDAMVAPETLRKAEVGGSLKHATRQRLEAWLARAEHRLTLRIRGGSNG